MPSNQMRQILNEESKISTIFIERQPEFDARLQEIKKELSESLKIDAASSMRRFSRFEIQGLNYEEIWKVNYQIFSTIGLDTVIEPTELFDQEYILPLTPKHRKYDLRAQSGLRLLAYYFPYREIFLRSSEILVFTEKVSEIEKKTIRDFFLTEADLSISQLKPATDLSYSYGQPELVPSIDNFTEYSTTRLLNLKEKRSLKLELTELKQLQLYYKELKRNPTETELLLVDQIWFARLSKSKSNPEFNKVAFAADVDREIINTHQLLRGNLADATNNKENKSKTNQLRFELIADHVSNKEVNAQLHTMPDVIKQSGMSGAIPLHALRLSLVNLEAEQQDEIKNNQTITRSKQAKTLRDYAKSAGIYAKKSNLPVSYVREYYSSCFEDQTWEISAVMAQEIQGDQTTREILPDDLIVILGAKTGLFRENIGSIAELNNIINNFIVNSNVQKILKTVFSLDNHGLAATLNEIDNGAILNLDVMPVVRSDLSGSEIALTKTKDRVIAIISSQDRHRFVDAAHANDLAATVIGKITADDLLEINFRGQKIINLSKSMLNYVPQKVEITAQVGAGKMPENKAKTISFPNYLIENLLKQNNSSQQGLINNFVNQINGKNILAALGGINQSSPEQGMIAKVDDLGLYSLVTQSYFPELTKHSPYHAAYFAVFSSYLKNVGLGGNPDNIEINLFHSSTGINSERDWGNLYSSLLGAYQAEQDLDLKRSETKYMLDTGVFGKSGFPITISFATSTKTVNAFSAATLKLPDLYGYRVDFPEKENGFPEIASTKQILTKIYQMINRGTIKHAFVCEADLATNIFKSCLGENLGFEFDHKLLNQDLFSDNYWKLIIFTAEELSNLNVGDTSLTYVGKTLSEKKIVRRTTEINLSEAKLSYEKTLSDIYYYRDSSKMPLAKSSTIVKSDQKQVIPTPKHDKPIILLPIFESTIGTQCLADELISAGAEVEQFVFFSSLTEQNQKSIRSFAEKISKADALVLPGGYDLNDQPDGVAKMLCLILETDPVKNAINELLQRKGKILGIGNGFQALVACGLLPYGRYRNWGDKQAYFTNGAELSNYNNLLDLEIVSNKGDWYQSADEVYQALLIADYWQLNMPAALWDFCLEHNLIVSKIKTGKHEYVESLTSPEGNILGRITHPELLAEEIINLPQKQDLNFFRRFVKNLLELKKEIEAERLRAEALQKQEMITISDNTENIEPELL